MTSRLLRASISLPKAGRLGHKACQDCSLEADCRSSVDLTAEHHGSFGSAVANSRVRTKARDALNIGESVALTNLETPVPFWQ